MSEQKQTVRKILHGNDARSAVQKGVDTVANAVKSTMGAKGRTAITTQGHSTKDGVTVARNIEILDDTAAAHGAKLIKKASQNTCDKAGDGTTSVCVIAQKIIQEGIRKIEEGKDSQDLKREIEDVRSNIIDALKDLASDDVDLKRIASISANSEELGDIVAEAVEEVGAEGLVTVEKTYGDVSIEFANGMQIDRGLMPGPFLTDGERRKAEHDDVHVLLFNGDIHDLKGFQKAISPVVEKGKPILIIADGFDDAVLRTMQLTAVQKGGKFIPVPAVAIDHDKTFEDLAAYTGATVLTEVDGFDNFRLSNQECRIE